MIDLPDIGFRRRIPLFWLQSRVIATTPSEISHVLLFDNLLLTQYLLRFTLLVVRHVAGAFVVEIERWHFRHPVIETGTGGTRGRCRRISSGVIGQASPLIEQHVRRVCNQIRVVDRFHARVVEAVPLRVVRIPAKRRVMPALKVLPVMVAYRVEIVDVLVVLGEIVLPRPRFLPRRPAQTT